ncbi:MAG: ferritin [Ignavibacteriaceae bacterium]|jgi:ferritin
MLSKKMQDALNNQLNEELFSSYLYLSIAAHFEEKNLKGFANWFKIQSSEEYGHAMKFYGFIVQTGGVVKLKQIGAPKTSWKSVMEAFKDTLAHEKKITGLIHKLVDLAMQSKDYATNNFLQWFVTEQVEEEATVEEILHKLEMIGDNKGGLYMLDRELGARASG